MDQQASTAQTDSITAIQDDSGRWVIQEPESGRTSRELFISKHVAAEAIEHGYFTWEEPLPE